MLVLPAVQQGIRDEEINKSATLAEGIVLLVPAPSSARYRNFTEKVLAYCMKVKHVMELENYSSV